jgi:urease accessory protein
MYDAALRSDVALPPRAVGALRLGFRRRGEATVLDELYQQGTLKARLPRPEPGAFLTAVTLNTAGGITAGDVLESRITWQAGASATVAAQAAERFYRADLGSARARVSTELVLHGAASAEWLPQEAILFDGCRIDRRLSVAMAGDASFLGVEWLVFGRAAMGEVLRAADVSDRWSITRDGVAVIDERVRLGGAVRAQLARPAMAGGACGVATILHVAPDAEARLESLRAALADAPAECGASAWNGLLCARVVGPNSQALRATVIAALAPLRGDRPLPKVWLC